MDPGCRRLTRTSLWKVSRPTFVARHRTLAAPPGGGGRRVAFGIDGVVIDARARAAEPIALPQSRCRPVFQGLIGPGKLKELGVG